MPIRVAPLKDRIQTGKEITRMAKEHWPDLDITGDLDKPLEEFFNKVRRIPYVENAFNEVVSRPLFLLDENIFPALDCKKKAVLMSAWLEAHGEDWRLITNSELPSEEIHHIFPQAYIDGEWRNVDATYEDYELFDPKPESTAAEELIT